MKQIILSIVALIWASAIYSQEIRMSFEDFQSKMRAAKIPGYAQLMDFENNDDGYVVSYFNSMEDFLLIKLEPFGAFDQYKRDAVAGTLNGCRTYFYKKENNGFLAVEMPEIRATLVIAPNKYQDKATCEKIAVATGLFTVKAETTDWPVEIPPTCRLDCKVLEFSKQDPSEGYRFEIRVKVVMSEQLKASVKKLRAGNQDEGSFVNFPGGVTMMYPQGELDDLNTCCKNGEAVELLYYIK